MVDTGGFYFLSSDDNTPVQTQSKLKKLTSPRKNKDVDIGSLVVFRATVASLPWLKNFLKEGLRVLDSESYHSIIISLIFVNSITMGIATFDFVTENSEVEGIFEMIDTIFLCIFIIEVWFQIACRGINSFKDCVFNLDFCIVHLSWILWACPETSYESVQVLRAFRILRALRLITRVVFMKKLVSTFWSILPRLGAISGLLLLIFYIFSVMFTILFKQMYRNGLTNEDYFSRLDTTLFTLFQIMTMDGWSTITREVMNTHAWAWIPFISFVILSSFIAVNMVVAVIHEAVANPMEGVYVKSTISKEWSIQSHKFKHPQRPRTSSDHSMNTCVGCNIALNSSMEDMNEKIDDLETKMSIVMKTMLDTHQLVNDLKLQLQQSNSNAFDHSRVTPSIPLDKYSC